MANSPESCREPWHLDKRVPIALIFTIVLQTAGAVWWASQISSDVQYHSHRIDRLETLSAEYPREIRSLDVRLARLEESASRQLETLLAIERSLRVASERAQSNSPGVESPEGDGG